MTASLAPNIETFRTFLKSRMDEKKRVTAVTAVTPATSNAYQLHGLVTLVTDVSASVRVCPDVEERQAMMEIDGQIPPIFSLAFAAFQVGCPSDRTAEEWSRATDDAGRFLDSHGQQAAALGWQANDLFAADGLAWALQGAHVAALTSSTVALSDGRTFKRNV